LDQVQFRRQRVVFEEGEEDEEMDGSG